MGLFEMIILLVVITTFGKIGLAIVEHAGSALKESAAERRARRAAALSGEPVGRELIEELEIRLTRIEDRLDFLEQLKAPERRRPLGPGGGGRPGGGGGGEA